MAVVTSNGLQGATGVQPTLTTLGQTGDTPTFLDNTGLVYDDTYLIRTRNSLRLRTNFIRSDTGRLTFPLPTGAWAFRFYMRPEPLADPVDVNEWRYLMDFGSDGAVAVRESSIQGISLWHQPQDLDTPPDLGTESGTHQDWDQLLRIEATYDGSSTLTVRGYTGDTNFFRENTYNISLSTNQITLGGYRYKRHSLLQNGDNDDDLPGTPVEDYQNKLLVWDPNALPDFGADGDFGNETQTATEDFQADVGLPVTGIAGAETQSALDLIVRLDADPNDYPVPLWIGNLAITDTAEFIGTLDPGETAPASGVEFGGTVVAEDTTTRAEADTVFDGTALVTKSAATDTDGTASFDGKTDVTKAVTTQDQQAGTLVSTDMVVTASSFIPPPPPIPPQAQLVVYDPAGAPRGVVPPTLSWEASIPLNDVGALTIRYSALSPGADILEDVPLEIGLEISRDLDDFFREYTDSRFILLRRQRDLSERSQTVTLTLASYGWMLRKAKLLDGIPTGEDSRSFTSVQVGDILRTLYDEAQNRFNFTAPTYVDMPVAFDGSGDSASQAWAEDPFDVTYPAGTDLFSILDTFSSRGFVDWRFNEREWQVYNAHSIMERDMTNLVFRIQGRSLTAVEDWAFDEFARRVQARREGGWFAVSTLPVDAWGNWEDFVNLPGGVDQNSTEEAARARLDQTKNHMEQFTYSYLVDASSPLPLVDFRVGDIVGVQTRLSPAVPVDRRVTQINLRHDADRILKADLTFGDRFLDQTLRFRRLMDRLSNRASRMWGSGVAKNPD